MKLVIVRHSLLSRGGDKMIAAHASHLAQRGHEVAVRTNVVDSVFKLDPRVRVEPLSIGGKVGTLLSALLEKHSADVVLADIIPLACLLWIRNRGKVVFYAQGFDASCYTTRWQKYLIHLLYLLGLSLFRVKSVAVAETVAEVLRRYARGPVTVVQNGVDTAAFYPDPRPELITLKGSRKSVLLLSRRDPSKGYDLGVSVLEGLHSLMPGEFEVWTVGDCAAGDFREAPHRDLGYLDEERLRQVMSSADLLLYPSRSEGFPLMVMEAFACRCPVVTTDAVPYAEEGVNALVARVGDLEGLAARTRELLTSAEKRQTLAEHACLFAQGHTLGRAMEELESRLESIAAAAEGNSDAA
jgi:glycosyltransferase involved in cell wall biosynthesis